MLATRNGSFMLRLGCGCRDPIKHDLGIRTILWSGARTKVKPDIFPGVTGLALQTYRCRGLVAALYHAIFTSRVLGDAINHTVFTPIYVLLKFLIGCVMTIGHKVAGRFPTFDIARWYRPCRACQITESRNKLQ